MFPERGSLPPGGLQAGENLVGFRVAFFELKLVLNLGEKRGLEAESKPSQTRRRGVDSRLPGGRLKSDKLFNHVAST